VSNSMNKGLSSCGRDARRYLGFLVTAHDPSEPHEAYTYT
jgi:hypothetical protein